MPRERAPQSALPERAPFTVAAPPIGARAAAEGFFTDLAADLPTSDAATMVITHLLPGQMDFLPVLDRVASVATVLPKPKSADQRTLEAVTASYRCDPLNRSNFADPAWLTAYLDDRAADRRLVLADIGGYFAAALAEVCAARPGLIAGIVEDTENGLRRYQELPTLPCPVYTVARSPLKEPEDRLVGEAIVFSIESLLRQLGEVLPGRQACVLGFGKIGAGIASALHARHVRVTVLDADPVRQAQAVSIGHSWASLPKAMATADLVVSATGSHAIGMRHLGLLRDGAILAGATSSDDEFDLTGLHDPAAGFTGVEVIPGVARYSRAGCSFLLLGSGNAVNFLHTSALGPAIHLIKAEIIAAVAQLATEPHAPGLHEVPSAVRARIAAAWVEAFQPSGTAEGRELAMTEKAPTR